MSVVTDYDPSLPAVQRFRGDYVYLSNFYNLNHRITDSVGITYYTAETYYQAQKFQCRRTTYDEYGNIDGGIVQRTLISKLSPSAAKEYTRGPNQSLAALMRPDWEQVKVEKMVEAVFLKFTKNPDLAKRLIATGHVELIEGNTWGDEFWGRHIVSGKGENMLGRILMALRTDFQNTAWALD